MFFKKFNLEYGEFDFDLDSDMKLNVIIAFLNRSIGLIGVPRMTIFLSGKVVILNMRVVKAAAHQGPEK